MRAALYARFSTDLQNVGSIADQFTACRAHAARIGATVVLEFADAAVSGASAANRPGLQNLLSAAEVGQIDVVITEALDRLSRSQGDTGTIYEDLRAWGVEINTISEGRVGELEVGLKGTMNALYIREIARKTKRGLSSVAREGRSAGGRCYGYLVRRELDQRGEVRAGLRSIDPAEAEIVRRIFREYAAGASPRAIAGRLNSEGVRGPRGGAWNASTINGNAERGNGVIHNELYAGVQVWGRQTWVKDRRTGKRYSKSGDQGEIVRCDVPELRIVDQGLWTAVQARYAAVSRHPGPREARRPKGLLSGLIRCGVCGGGMTATGPDRRLQCSTRREKGVGVCSNGRTAKVADVERRVLAAIHDNLLHPAVIKAAIEEFQMETTRRRTSDRARRSGLEKELAEVKRRALRLVDQVADGELSGAAVKERLVGLEARRAVLESELQAQDSAEIVDLHPAIAAAYRKRIETLQDRLEGQLTIEREEAREALRAVVAGVRIIPLTERGQYAIDLEGELASLLQLNKPEEGVRFMVGAGTGFEPVTFRL